MTHEKKTEIINSFPPDFEEGVLDLQISVDEFKIFENGIYAQDMDSKWNIFAISDTLYFARSWTNHCIYKVFVDIQTDSVILKTFQVNRDQKQYRSFDLEYDRVLLLKLIQAYLNRQDIYVDPKLELPLIKAAVLEYDKDNVCEKSIGLQAVGLTRQIYSGLVEHQNDHCTVYGWEEFDINTKSIHAEQELVSLYIFHKQKQASTTFYFDKDVTKRLGQITMTDKKTSSS
jgi:hypothetical protein